MPTLVERPASKYFQEHQAHRQLTVNLAGRPKGRRSARGVRIRESIEKVFEGLDGWEGMMAWAKDNPDLFYASVVPKLLPHELAESGLAGHITVVINRYPEHGKGKSVRVIEASEGDASTHVAQAAPQAGPDLRSIMGQNGQDDEAHPDKS